VSAVSKLGKYEVLARGPFLEPVVEVARAYVAAAIPDPEGTERHYWALSCLPGTTPRRLSAITMRTMDVLVAYRAGTGADARVDALVIVERSTLEAGFGSRAAAAGQHPRLRFADSDYYDAGPDQLLISGAHDDLVKALRDDIVADAARRLAARAMGRGRVLHWRGHNDFLADHVLGRG
jgi:hypothetical protein